MQGQDGYAWSLVLFGLAGILLYLINQLKGGN